MKTLGKASYIQRNLDDKRRIREKQLYIYITKQLKNMKSGEPES